MSTESAAQSADPTAPSAAKPDAAQQDRRTPAQIEADIARTRAELRATLDELSDRLNPRNQARDTVAEARAAIDELMRKVTGGERPADAAEPTRRGWIALGVGAALAAAVVAGIVRKL